MAYEAYIKIYRMQVDLCSQAAKTNTKENKERIRYKFALHKKF